MSRITIDTLLTKTEFIVLSLGGKPDEDKEEDKKNQDKFDKVSDLIKTRMKVAKEKIQDRNNVIADKGF
jgi:hypothetical protein